MYAARSVRDWSATLRGDARVLAEAAGNDSFFHDSSDFEGSLIVEASYSTGVGLRVVKDARFVKRFRHAFIGEFNPFVPMNPGPTVTTIGYRDIKVHASNGTYDCGQGRPPCTFDDAACPDAVGWGPVEFAVTEVSPQVIPHSAFYVVDVDAWLPSA